MKFCMVGGLHGTFLRFEFHHDRLSGFRAVCGRNLPIPIDLAIGYTTTCTTVQVVIIAAKASKRLYFLKQLKRAGVPPRQLLHFYATVIRPVLEYFAPVWHYARLGRLLLLDHRLNSWSRYKNVLFTLFILLLGP